MAPPKYDDLGKDAKDLLGKNYHFGVAKFEGKSTSANKTEFVANLTHNPENDTVESSLETKWKPRKDCLKGLTFSEKFATNNNSLFCKLSYDNIKNLVLDAEASFKRSTGDKGLKVKGAYQSEYLHAVGDVDLDFAGPTVHGSAVFGYKNMLAGYQASYDTANSKLVANNVALGLKASDYNLNLAVLDATKFVGSVYHKVNDDMAVAAQANWDAGSDATAVSFGLKKQLDSDTFLKAKIDNKLRIGLSYAQNICGGVQVTLSSLINGKESSGHKIGCHLNLSA